MRSSRARRGTYSIVARDPQTGQLGVAVQSHWFSVGSVVTWAAAGVGAVATQANAEIAYGPQLLERLGGGADPATALAELVAADPAGASRQVAAVDVHGRVAAHTGTACMAFAGHVTGDGVSCQGNIMANDTVWGAMLAAYEAATSLDLTDRLLAALDAAQAAGGDIRGKQSSALLVVPASGEPWRREVELRVEDHPDPNVELRRLVGLHRAYAVASEGDEAVGAGEHARASELFRRACALAPENHELRFWAGIGAAEAGDLDEGVAYVREAIAAQPGWAELLPRLTPEQAPSAAAILQRL